ncbi:hypothetical protein DERF_006322 [Dermatophagoides farinae]|uniref:Uncharacterized protein n=1 Tax=Dermatophagoides farinae TaxID=6954 RepID=A0A922I7J8_DERFA|nr:hypothetical protein DERF_006322 [Dermatophagoides farinae]
MWFKYNLIFFVNKNHILNINVQIFFCFLFYIHFIITLAAFKRLLCNTYSVMDCKIGIVGVCASLRPRKPEKKYKTRPKKSLSIIRDDHKQYIA